MTSGGSTGRPEADRRSRRRRWPTRPSPRTACSCAASRSCPGRSTTPGPSSSSWQCAALGRDADPDARASTPEACLRLIERHRVDWALFVPTMMQRIWKLPARRRARRYDLSSLRRVMCTGAPSPAVAEARVDRVARPREDLGGLRRHRAHRGHADLRHGVARAPGLRREAAARAQDADPPRRRQRAARPARSARSSCCRPRAAARPTATSAPRPSATRRRLGERSATWAGSTPTATSTSPTARPT